jgi:FkbM family methyltransferase
MQVNGMQIVPTKEEYGWIHEQMSTGKYALHICAAIHEFVKKGDTCLDIGANIGYVSAYMASIVGLSGHVYAYEPVRMYWQMLDEINNLNGGPYITVRPFALSDEDGVKKIYIAGERNIGLNTFLENFEDNEGNSDYDREAVVDIRRFDRCEPSISPGSVSFIKIDVEGYEFKVLRGMVKYLRYSDRLPVMVIEVIRDAYAGADYSLEDLDAYLSSFGYTTFDVVSRKPLRAQDVEDAADILAIPK